MGVTNVLLVPPASHPFFSLITGKILVTDTVSISRETARPEFQQCDLPVVVITGSYQISALIWHVLMALILTEIRA